MSGNEKAIENHGRRVGKQRGCWVVKLALLGGRGWPDHTIMAPGGRIAFIEYKRPGGAFQPLQVVIHKRLRKLGFCVAVLDSKAGIDTFFNDWLGKSNGTDPEKD